MFDEVSEEAWERHPTRAKLDMDMHSWHDMAELLRAAMRIMKKA